MTEYKRYNTASRYEVFAIKLTGDAEVKETSNGKMVRVPFVDKSKTEGDEDMWIEATAADFHAELAANLKKDDVIPHVEGKLTMRKGKDGKVFLNLKNAKFDWGVDLMMELRKRGEGGGGGGGKPKKGGALPAKKVAKSKPRIEEPEDDDDDDGED